MNYHDHDFVFPEPFPASCRDCGQYVGTFTRLSEAVAGSHEHRPVCPVYRRRQAVFNLLFDQIADRLTTEGFPCQ